MSMLAEGRKKVKYSVNPRGTTWSNDEDKYGQKLMEKFGWQKGKGLGANEDGRVEHVKASGKTNTKGFGFKNTDNNNWICHQDDFDSLLSELNANHGRSDQDGTEKVISLEEKSKSAKKRVHYHKHAKGKDLSQRSSEDLDCIFGRKKSKRSKVKEALPNAQETNVDSPSEENTHGIQTIQSNQSVQEYFAMKMAKLKVKKNNDAQQSCLSDTLRKEEVESDQSVEGLTSNEASAADNEEKEENTKEKSKKKKKKKKSKEKEREKEEEEDEDDDCYCSSLRSEEKGKTDSNEVDDNSGENGDENLSRKSKRKKRSKEYINAEVEETSQNVVEDDISIAEDVEMTTGEINKPSKKKLDKKSKVQISVSDSNAAADSKILENSAFCERDPQDSTNTELATISKKTMLSNDKETEIAENETTSKPKKNKKNKRKKEDVIVENEVDKSVTFEMENSNSSNSNIGHPVDNNEEEAIVSPPKKKKKKSSKKSKSEEAEESLDTQTADGSIGDETKVHDSVETEKFEPSTDSACIGSNSLDAFKFSAMNSTQVPQNRYGVKNSAYAINTATEKFQKAGANIDTISGYGYTMQ